MSCFQVQSPQLSGSTAQSENAYSLIVSGKYENYESTGIFIHLDFHHLMLLHNKNPFKSKPTHFPMYQFQTDVHITTSYNLI